ncbi:MAG: PDZ domain-containing protein [Opitutaceae bacterium]
MLILSPLARATVLRVLLCCAGWTGAPLSWAQEAAERPLEDMTILPPFSVKGDRPEELGFHVTGVYSIPGPSFLMVREVFPNTAAAKAGLRPGELIVKMDGKSLSMFSVQQLNKIPQRKWAELEAGKKSVVFSLEVRAPETKKTRTVTLVLPSPAPHWGSEKWSAPAGRTRAVVPEAGPLAALVRELLDHGIWSVLQDESLLGAPSRFKAPILGYEWRILQPSGLHRIWVTQQRGKTEITLGTAFGVFLTSPSGAMEKAQIRQRTKQGQGTELPPEEIRAQFAAEVDFWLTKVGRVTGRWPFEALSGPTGAIIVAGSGVRTSFTAPAANGATARVDSPLSGSFLQLPVATAEQKNLFSDALGKVGFDEACWAYTETSRSLSDGRVTVVRFDPSKPPGERKTLLKVDGKVPKPAYLQQWRDEAEGTLPGLGELPPLSSIVDVNDVRIYADEMAAVVFELPVNASNAEFPRDKFQARFRVNKTHRGFEDFSVKLRDPIRVTGVAKVTEAGLEARFQTLDPALAPQPVQLKAGGGVRVLLVKFSRSFEATRADFKRVTPFEDVPTAAK